MVDCFGASTSMSILGLGRMMVFVILRMFSQSFGVIRGYQQDPTRKYWKYMEKIGEIYRNMK